MNYLITGGSGFIGSALIRFLVKNKNNKILNVDKLTYASNNESIFEISKNKNYNFVKADICDKEIILKLIFDFKPNVVMHLAAESHVDRSIDDPLEFINTNILGTSILLECFKNYWINSLKKNKDNFFCFHHISTDEVYGSLDVSGKFREDTPYDPSSPYSASKASADHLVRAWNKTYKLPIIITNCSNNYGPFQFPEKLIPTLILNALEGKKLPIYGDGSQVRDWLYVEDHVAALYKVITKGKIGETYNIGGNSELKNIEVANVICEILDNLIPESKKPLEIKKKSFKSLITFVEDRPGHDKRYAIDINKIKKNLGWEPTFNFKDGMHKTVEWYLNNKFWCDRVQTKNFQRQRLGIFKI
tara:strand:- start:2921 stop:4000 length:1080 start_codon:yes stop_codon:yes gene_type:complete